MATEFETIDVWIGEFPSKEKLDLYFREVFDPDDDDAPISEFAGAMKEPYYDFVERQFHESCQTVGSPLRDHSYSRSYADKVVRAAAELGVTAGNTTVLVWGNRLSDPVSVFGGDHWLRYIGRFDCNPSVGA
jgi:hypothetical protein